jgi:hypothetical protein
MRFLVLVVALLNATACATSDAPRSAADSQAAHIAEVAAAGGVVDSILPIDEQLRRFSVGLDRTDTLRHASPSRDALVRRFLEALSTSDTTSLNAMVLDRSEFAFLYYPTAAISKPPYEAPPQLLWGQIISSSNEGLSKLLVRTAGESIALDGIACDTAVVSEGDNLLHSNCRVTLRIGRGAPTTGRLFGTIIERGGRFKFIGYANAL